MDKVKPQKRTTTFLNPRYLGDLLRRSFAPALRKDPAKRGRRNTKNHGQGRSKVRRKMAAKSNKINRKRCKRWKH